MYLDKESNSTSTLNMGIGAYPHICAMIANINCQPDRISKPCEMGTSVGEIIIFERFGFTFHFVYARIQHLGVCR